MGGRPARSSRDRDTLGPKGERGENAGTQGRMTWCRNGGVREGKSSTDLPQTRVSKKGWFSGGLIFVSLGIQSASGLLMAGHMLESWLEGKGTQLRRWIQRYPLASVVCRKPEWWTYRHPSSYGNL